MIDKIRITIENFTGNFDNCVKKITRKKAVEQTEIRYNNYLLKKELQAYPYPLKVRQDTKTGKVRIIGSIRRWYNHRYYYHDLSSTQLADAISEIATALNIPLDEICNAKFSQCEIGQSVRTKYPVGEIVTAMVKHGIAERTQYATTVYFNNKGFNDKPPQRVKSIKIYDKSREHAKHGNERQVKLTKHLEKIGVYFMRAETTLYDHQAFIDNDLGHIRTVGDLINNYPCLFEYWTREISRFVVFTAIDTNKKMSKKERLVATELEELGYELSLEKALKLCANKHQRSKKRKEREDVIKKYQSKTEYRKQLLDADVLRHLHRKSKIQQGDLVFARNVRILKKIEKVVKKNA